MSAELLLLSVSACLEALTLLLLFDWRRRDLASKRDLDPRRFGRLPLSDKS